MTRRSARLDRRIMQLLKVSSWPLGHGEIWMILGGSSGRIYVALARLEAAGRVTSDTYPFDGNRRKYRSAQ